MAQRLTRRSHDCFRCNVEDGGSGDESLVEVLVTVLEQACSDTTSISRGVEAGSFNLDAFSAYLA